MTQPSFRTNLTSFRKKGIPAEWRCPIVEFSAFEPTSDGLAHRGIRPGRGGVWVRRGFSSRLRRRWVRLSRFRLSRGGEFLTLDSTPSPVRSFVGTLVRRILGSFVVLCPNDPRHTVMLRCTCLRQSELR